MKERVLLPSSSSSSREASESSDSDGYLNVLRSLVAVIITEGSGCLNSQVQTCWKRDIYGEGIETGRQPS